MKSALPTAWTWFVRLDGADDGMWPQALGCADFVPVHIENGALHAFELLRVVPILKRLGGVWALVAPHVRHCCEAQWPKPC